MGNNNKNFAALIYFGRCYDQCRLPVVFGRGYKTVAYAVDVQDETAKATLENGTFGGNYYNGCTAVQVEKGTANINGGSYSLKQLNRTWCAESLLMDISSVINCIDAAYKNGTAKGLHYRAVHCCILRSGLTVLAEDPIGTTSVQCPAMSQLRAARRMHRFGRLKIIVLLR